ncbi:hypothetical protein P175DRAFT_0503862 [Aspergillus ochraceoroseus IBT 24754]|uniref:alpha-amylase n=2 Tax=Aspergillus ochraceoroseus TaxID=138278 RepID=A0A2T5LNV9_9EURO|nr:uncharacterized protein P175DRAFT_0503862 [Aspergillus ochraceoroseus IBT 24754]KKK16279.1 putative alpha amylase [Aspergillus ochraceoroseus]PTU17966.1 hypothetical protein P175DRAFT_0503862 [Aspergillus ochraceoroseus IBT 24754]
MQSISCIAALILLAKEVTGLTPAEWRNQSIYFLLTDRFARTDGSTTAACDVSQREYCGGSWQGIINQLDYIQGMGFSAIWISPITEQIPDDTGHGRAYHGYWQKDIYNVNSNFGSADDIKILSTALHDRGMYLMIDVVANHMGYPGAGTAVDYSSFTPFNSSSYFHSYCEITNYDNQSNVENCWLGDNIVSLPDLNTQASAVRTIWYDWIEEIVTNYSVDGLRVDTTKHVEKDFWPGYTKAAGVYCVGEVLNGDPAYTCPYQQYMDGILNYPIYYQLLYAFESSSGRIVDLYHMINSVASDCKDPTLLGNFIENHDNPRFASYTNDFSQAKAVIAYVFLTDGIPIIYAGQEQHFSGGADPHNREAIWLSGYPTTSELYKFIAKTNSIRKLAISKDSSYLTSLNTPFYTDSHTIAMRKGSKGSQVITVLSNLGSTAGPSTLSLSNHGYSAGSQLVELYTCSSVQVDSSGRLAVPMVSGLPRVFVLSSWTSGSSICGTTSTTTTPTTATTTSTTTTPCTEATTVSVVFDELIKTTYGETVYMVGSIAQLGDWDADDAVALSASAYTSSNPLWRVTISLAVGTSFEYKFIIKKKDGSVVWESDPNRSYTVPSGCVGTTPTASSSWR